MSTFEGFPDEALVFYEGLEADNSKPYWTDHKAQYDEHVAAPMRALIARLEPEFGPGKFFRPYRDVRFSKDKTPYKDHAAAVLGQDQPGRSARYLQVGADGLFVAGGYWHTESDQVKRLRDAVADDVTGAALTAVLDGLRAAGFETGGTTLVRVPRPWDAQHPRAELLRHKTLTSSRHWIPQDWLHTPEAAERVAEAWRAMSPLGDWLERHVGPSAQPARGRR